MPQGISILTRLRRFTTRFLPRMTAPLTFEELQIGDCWRSRGRTITETDVVNFANLTGDYDPLHVDHHYASRTPFGRPVAHGLLGMSFLAGLSSNCPAVHTDAFLAVRQWEFLLPTFIGDTVYAVTQVVDLQSTSRRHGRVTWVRQLINQKDEVVQRGASRRWSPHRWVPCRGKSTANPSSRLIPYAASCPARRVEAAGCCRRLVVQTKPLILGAISTGE